MKIILAPDSFKGTMSSIQVCNIISTAIKKHFENAEIIKVPVADGGEGTVDCFLEAAGGKKVKLKVKGPYFKEIDSFYGVLSDNTTAVIEIAAASGLPLVENRKNPALTTTFGAGQLIRHAIEHGCREIIIGLGGSCTNDGGAGMAAALGYRFFDEQGHEFIPVGGTLDKISEIDSSGRLAALDECTIVAACDVDNPLCGANGASFVFGPQKGADADMVRILDENLLRFSGVVKRDLGLNLTDIPGAGAAGGLGMGVMAFAGAELKSGIDIVLDTVKFDDMLRGADLIITGEGKLDRQSLRGKVVIGVAKRAGVNNVPVVAIVGDIGDDIEEAYSVGLSAVMSINRVAVPFESARLRCENDLELTAETLMRIMKIKS